MEKIVNENEELKQVTPEVQPQAAPNQQVINLDDVGFMVMIGRYKNNEPFMVSVNIPDIFITEGLLDYGKRKMDAVYEEHFKNEGK
ncbi:hypothetical protein D3C80_1864810 [compost metagenome]